MRVARDRVSGVFRPASMVTLRDPCSGMLAAVVARMRLKRGRGQAPAGDDSGSHTAKPSPED